VISAPSAIGELMLELGVLSGLLLVLNVKVKVIEVKHVPIQSLEVVNIAQRQKWLTEEMDGLFLGDNFL